MNNNHLNHFLEQNHKNKSKKKNSHKLNSFIPQTQNLYDEVFINLTNLHNDVELTQELLKSNIRSEYCLISSVGDLRGFIVGVCSDFENPLPSEILIESVNTLGGEFLTNFDNANHSFSHLNAPIYFSINELNSDDKTRKMNLTWKLISEGINENTLFSHADYSIKMHDTEYQIELILSFELQKRNFL